MGQKKETAVLFLRAPFASNVFSPFQPLMHSSTWMHSYTDVHIEGDK